MSAQVVMLRAPRPRLLRAAVRRLMRFRASLTRAAAQRRSRLVADARLRFEERPWARADPRDGPLAHQRCPL